MELPLHLYRIVYSCFSRLLKSFSIINITTANILFSQAVYPDSSIHSVVEGSKDETVQLTAVAKIRLNYSLCDFYGLLSEVPFPMFRLF